VSDDADAVVKVLVVVVEGSVVDWLFPPSVLELSDSVQREVVLEVVPVGPDPVSCPPGVLTEEVLVVTVGGM